MYMTRQS